MKRYEGLYGVKAERIYYCPFHMSPNLRVLYVLEGSVKLRWISGEYVLEKGNIEILNINEPVLMEQTDSENLILTFEFSGERAKQYCDIIDKGIFNCNTTLFYSSVTEQKDQEVLKRKLRLIYHYCFIDDGDSLIEKTVKEIVVLICEKCHDLKNMFRNVFVDDVRGARFLRIYTYILENCQKKINLRELAEGEYISPQYLSKEFNDRLKINFKDTLEYFRIIQSVRYLITTNMSVMQISENCGFSAPRYFYKHFDHYMHCTPKEFRKIYLQRREEITPLPINCGSIGAILHSFENSWERESGNAREKPDAANENTDLLRLLKAWESCGSFATAEIPQETLAELLDIAFGAPNFGKSGELQVIREFMQNGAVGFVFCVRHQREEARSELLVKTAAAAVAAWQLCLAAEAKGLGAQITSDVSNAGEQIGEVGGLPPCIQAVLVVTVGYPER